MEDYKGHYNYTDNGFDSLKHQNKMMFWWIDQFFYTHIYLNIKGFKMLNIMTPGT